MGAALALSHFRYVYSDVLHNVDAQEHAANGQDGITSWCRWGRNRVPRPPGRPRRRCPRRGRPPVPPTFASALRRALRRCCGRPTRRWRKPGWRSSDADIVACLALAGASEPTQLAAARAYSASVPPRDRSPPTRMPPASARMAARTAASSSSARAASAGASSAGASIVSAAGAFPSPTKAAAPGSAARWRAACCGHTTAADAWSGLLKKVLERFDGDPHVIVRWMGAARPRDFAALAPLVIEYAGRDDAVAHELMREAAGAHRRARPAIGGAGRDATGAGRRPRQEHGAVAGGDDAGASRHAERAMR